LVSSRISLLDKLLLPMESTFSSRAFVLSLRKKEQKGSNNMSLQPLQEESGITCPITNQSEVARLRAAIEAEHLAGLRALKDFRMAGRHDFITARMENIGLLTRLVIQQVGDQQVAMQLIAEDLEALREEVPHA
jgi:hypothetical protein